MLKELLIVRQILLVSLKKCTKNSVEVLHTTMI